MRRCVQTFGWCCTLPLLTTILQSICLPETLPLDPHSVLFSSLFVTNYFSDKSSVCQIFGCVYGGAPGFIPREASRLCIHRWCCSCCWWFSDTPLCRRHHSVYFWPLFGHCVNLSSAGGTPRQHSTEKAVCEIQKYFFEICNFHTLSPIQQMKDKHLVNLPIVSDFALQRKHNNDNVRSEPNTAIFPAKDRSHKKQKYR